MLSLKSMFVPEWPFLLHKQQVITEKAARPFGKAGGNCELIAISFIPSCICQRCRGTDRTDGDVLLLLFILRSHMVSIPVDKEELSTQDMSTVSKN